MLILGIDTTEKNINIALTENNELLADIEQINPKNEDIIILINSLFEKISKSPQDLKGVGVITGPGGYTGTRAGVTVAKTLAQFLNIPVVGFTKPEAIILSYKSSDLICPMIDIKRNETYTCIAINNNSDIKYFIEPQVINIIDWSEKLKALKQKVTLLTNEFRDNELFSLNNLENEAKNITIDSEFYLKPYHIAILAQKFIENAQGKSFHEVNPFYVREAI